MKPGEERTAATEPPRVGSRCPLLGSPVHLPIAEPSPSLTGLGGKCYLGAMAQRGRNGARAVLRLATALTLLSLLAAPLARAAASPLRGNAHHCCPDGAPRSDPSVPCQFAVPFACCGQAGLPETTVDQTPPTTSLLAPLVLETLAALVAPPRLRESLFALAHPPIPLLLQTSVLLL